MHLSSWSWASSECSNRLGISGAGKEELDLARLGVWGCEGNVVLKDWARWFKGEDDIDGGDTVAAFMNLDFISSIASGVGTGLEFLLGSVVCLRTGLGVPVERLKPPVLSGLLEKTSSGSGLRYRSECRESRRARGVSFPIKLNL